MRQQGSIHGQLPYIPPKARADATLTQANPVQNTWYTILDTTRNCRVVDCSVLIATTGETLEVRWTVDGQVISGTLVANADTNYYANLDTISSGTRLVISTSDYQCSYQIEGRSVKIEVRKTTANGAGDLKGAVSYGTW